jgi:hypothetical protein
MPFIRDRFRQPKKMKNNKKALEGGINPKK